MIVSGGRIMIELEVLLAEVTPESPCGLDLGEAYDPEYRELDQAAQGKPEQQFGDTLIPAEEPHWASVEERASALLARSKDLRVAVCLTRALAHTQGLPGFHYGLQLIHGLLDRYWDDVHPRLDAEEGNDPTMRLNALASLADPQTMLHDLRAAVFIRSRQHGQILVRDVEIAVGKLPAAGEGTGPSLALVESAICDGAEDNRLAIEAARSGSSLTARLSGLLVGKVGPERAVDLRQLGSIFSSLGQVCDRVLADKVVTTEGLARLPEHGDALTAVDSPASATAAGAMRSRDDAIRLLDMVCQYLERNEPTNPAPLLIRRAKRLMTMDFMEIIRDLAPDGLTQIQTIAGLDKE